MTFISFGGSLRAWMGGERKEPGSYQELKGPSHPIPEPYFQGMGGDVLIVILDLSKSFCQVSMILELIVKFVLCLWTSIKGRFNP